MKRRIAIMLAVLTLVMSLPIQLFAAETTPGFEVDDEQEPGNQGAGTVEDLTTSNEWPLGGMVPVDTYSNNNRYNSGSYSIKYKGTNEEAQYVELEFTQVSLVYEGGKYNLDQLKASTGWSHLILHFDKELYDQIDFQRSYIKEDRENGKNGYSLNNGLTTMSEYKTDDYSVPIPLIYVFSNDYDGIREFGQRATIRLYLKNPEVLDKRTNLVQYRIAAKTNANNSPIYVRKYNTGHNAANRYLEDIELNKITGNTAFIYNEEVPDADYTNYSFTTAYGYYKERMSNAYSTIEIDWEKEQLHVNYIYQTNQAIYGPNNVTQFVQLLPSKLLDTLVLRKPEGSNSEWLAKFTLQKNDGYKSDDILFRSTEEFSTNPKNANQSAFRLRIPNTNDYNHDWKWAAEKTKYTVNNSEYDLTTGRGMFAVASGGTRGSYVNRITFNIDAEKFAKAFSGFDELRFTSFFVSIESPETEGGIIKFSEATQSAGVYAGTKIYHM